MEPVSTPRDLARRALARARAERGTEPRSAGTGGVHVRVGPCEVPGPEEAGPACVPRSPEEARRAAAPARRPGREVVTARCLAATPDGSTYRVPTSALVTPLAREEARRRGLRLVEGGGDGGPRLVALGSDHGGLELKSLVGEWLCELGHRVLDLGTHGSGACDYPDFARAVAEAVAEGRADVGVVVDGAGIGSAIAANKVPGVRAANCWDERTARNAREHNLANVLTLGGGLLEPVTARAVLAAFLATPHGTGRHARRVAKIDAIERRYGWRPSEEPAT